MRRSQGLKKKKKSCRFGCFISSVGFPSSSAGKESTCNAGDPGLIPGLGRSPGEAKAMLPVSMANPVRVLLPAAATTIFFPNLPGILRSSAKIS